MVVVICCLILCVFLDNVAGLLHHEGAASMWSVEMLALGKVTRSNKKLQLSSLH
ncbi:hypothetical protein XENTR_v10005679 [Xenopus tropicalis]|nr:hypothetical protein XENTR_v10005679 [Xenopus tropicalis]